MYFGRLLGTERQEGGKEGNTRPLQLTGRTCLSKGKKTDQSSICVETAPVDDFRRQRFRSANVLFAKTSLNNSYGAFP